MSHDRLRRVEELYHAALSRAPEVRGAFVAEACGPDESLRHEIDSLLNYAGTDGFLGQPAGAAAPRLTSGQVLGHYEVLAPLGAGGMGEVYRARDTVLGREVAIKVLPLAVAADPDVLRRFEREARTAAALAHPNIVTIHSVEQEGDVHFLTMESIEGVPLGDRIPRGGVDLDRFLEIAIPLADAVAAAHGRGIVHRDLKPSNVMLTADGRVKVLDFGLAKLKPPTEGVDLRTEAPSLTAEGRLLGTVAYMSPEQAEGRDVDHRSDIFSLGVVLYEVATGTRPFAGETTVSLLSSILKETPTSVSELKPALPRQLGRIIRRCLVKDPGHRCQSARDLRNELEDLRDEYATGAVMAPEMAGHRRARRWRSFAWIAVGIAAFTATAFAYLAWRGAIDLRSLSRSAAAPPFAAPVKFHIPVPESVKRIDSLAMSPDGARLAFAAGGGLYIYDLATGDIGMVKGINGPAQYPFWSPNGRFIAYFQAGKLMRIPAEGGIAETICDLEKPARGGSWGAEDIIVFAQLGDGIYRVVATGGIPARITTLDPTTEEAGHLWPHFLPDGRSFTYMTLERRNKIYIASVDSSQPRRLVAPGPGAIIDVGGRAFALSGFLVTAEGGILRARTLSPAGTGTAGEPASLAEDIRWSDSRIPGDRLLAASGAVLAYSVEKPRRSQFSLVDRRGVDLQAIGPPLLQDLLGTGRPMWSLSPDGTTLAFTHIPANRIREIWLLARTRATPDRFAFTSAGARLPLWNPLSDRIVFTNTGIAGDGNLYAKRVGGDVEGPLGGSGITYQLKVAHDWRGDGTLLFAMPTVAGDHNLWILRDGAGGKPEPWFPSTASSFEGQFSPDGEWGAYASNETGRNEVYVRRFPGVDGRQRISSAGGRLPRWRRDGKALFYLEGDVLMEVELDIGGAVKPGVPRKLFSLGENCGYAVLPDARQFVVCRPIDPVPPPAITVVVNWAAGLKRE